MRERRWRRENLFNPYIVLADVTIATIVIFVVLLISSETKGDSERKELHNVKERLASYESRDERRDKLLREIAQKNDDLTPRLKRMATQWQQEKIYVSFASGSNTFLIRVYGTGLWDPRTGNFSPEGRHKTNTVVSAIQAKCQEYLKSPKSPTLIEIRIEGHCSDKAGSASLERSLERAKTVRGLFPEAMRRFISVSGAGSDRPAYETTPTAIWKQLPADNPLIDRLQNLERSGEDLSTEARLQDYLQKKKTAITDRVDIILVYSGLQQDNNFVYPRIDDGEQREWINDVSTPKTDKRFLRQGKDDAL